MKNPLGVQVESAHAIELISRAEIDMQIATAKRYPREMAKVKAEIIELATLDEETAASCFYSVPRGSKTISGPSVRLAEIAMNCFGNLRAGNRIIETVTDGGNPHVMVQAVAHDLERNNAVTIEKRRRIMGKRSKGGLIDEDDIQLAANAGSAIAFRDAIFKVVPGALVKAAYEAARHVAIGDAKSLNDRRAKAIEAFGKMGVSQERVLAVVEKKTLEEIGLEELGTLLGLFNAIKEGASTIDDAFPLAPKKTVEKPEFKDEVKAPPHKEGALFEKMVEQIAAAGLTPDAFLEMLRAVYPALKDVKTLAELPRNAINVVLDDGVADVVQQAQDLIWMKENVGKKTEG